MSKKKNQKIKMEHVDRLSRGKRSGINIGSRAVGHHLHKFEREIYERSLKKKFLEVDERSRANLVNLWDKVCIVKNWKHIVLVKSADRKTGEVLLNKQVSFKGLLHDAKDYAASHAKKYLAQA